jgi:hypothetical protein
MQRVVEQGTQMLGAHQLSPGIFKVNQRARLQLFLTDARMAPAPYPRPRTSLQGPTVRDRLARWGAYRRTTEGSGSAKTRPFVTNFWLVLSFRARPTSPSAPLNIPPPERDQNWAPMGVAQ